MKIISDDLIQSSTFVKQKTEHRTLEALTANDGSQIPAGAKIKGRVTSVRNNEVVLRFEEIDTGRGKSPIVASVAGVAGEKDVKARVGKEGEISSSGGRGKSAAIGSAVGAAIGAAAGAAKGGPTNTAIGAGIGAGAGAGVGAAAGGRDLAVAGDGQASNSRLKVFVWRGALVLGHS